MKSVTGFPGWPVATTCIFVTPAVDQAPLGDDG